MGRGQGAVLFDVEIFKNDFYMYLMIPEHLPLIIKNPSAVYVRIFLKRANVDIRCIMRRMYWDLYKYLYSKSLLKLKADKGGKIVCQ